MNYSINHRYMKETSRKVIPMVSQSTYPFDEDLYLFMVKK